MQINQRLSPTSSEPSVRIPVDVRRFPDPPTCRRLRLRLSLRRAVLLRRSIRSRGVDGGDRGSQAPSAPSEIAAVIAAQQRQRRARASHRSGTASGRWPHGGHSHQSAGRAVRRSAFTLLKALTALKLADQVTRDHHVTAVAIFWIDAEDHDWEESGRGRLRRGARREQWCCHLVRRRKRHRWRRCASTNRSAPSSTSSRSCCPLPNSARRSSRTCARPTCRASAWPKHSADGSNECSAIAD